PRPRAPAAARAATAGAAAAGAATAGTAALAYGNAGVTAAAAIGLGGEDLVVERAQVHAGAGPGIDAVLRGDGAAAARRGSVLQVLLEGAGVAGDAWLVDLLVLVEVERAAVARDLALVRAGGVRRAGVVLGDVVLDERVCRPAVERYQRGPAGGAEAVGEV